MLQTSHKTTVAKWLMKYTCTSQSVVFFVATRELESVLGTLAGFFLHLKHGV
jgi:hypothetical protein